MYLHAYSTRDTRKSAHCLWLVGHTPGESKRGRDTESDAVIRLEERHTFFSINLSYAVLPEIYRMCFG